MRISFQNGILDFFFPYTRKIRFEAGTRIRVGKDGTRKIKREFGTFRAFFWHYYYELFANRIKEITAFWALRPQLGAIAFDAKTDSGNIENTTPWSFTHTSTGSNLVMTMDAFWWSSSDTITINAKTYNSVSLTQQVNQADGSAAIYYATVFYLANPATGANTASIGFTSNSYGEMGVQTFSGCNTTTPVDTSAVFQSASGTSASKTITTNNANSFIVDALAVSNASTSATQGGSQTSNWIDTTRYGASSRQATTTAGNYTMSWTWTGNAVAGLAIIAINEAVASTFIPQITIL